MTLSQLIYLMRWDMRANQGVSFDTLRAKLLLSEFRLEQYIYQKTHHHPHALKLILWFICRGPGSIFQWFLCNANMPGSVSIGRGLHLPHPQNIIITAFAEIGEFCTIYHNVTIARNSIKLTGAVSPQIGDKVLIGAGTIILGGIIIGSEVLIGAGTVVTKSVPNRHRVTCTPFDSAPRSPAVDAAEVGSERHLRDPYSIWR